MRRLATLAVALLTVSGPILLEVSTIHAETIVGGFIGTDTHWQIADSPFIASSSVLVTNDATLTIDPGVVVQFAPGTGLVVNDGSLSARGTETDRITFTSQAEGDTNRWSGIGFGDGTIDAVFDGDFTYTSGSIVEYAIVEQVLRTGFGAIRIEESAPFIHQNIVQDNLTTGLSSNLATNLRVSSNVFQRNDFREGGLKITDSDVTIIANVITDNTGVGLDAHLNRSTVSIIGNTIERNAVQVGAAGARITVNYDSDLIIESNQIVANTASSEYSSALDLTILRGDVSFSNNFVTENETGSAIDIDKQIGSLTFEGDRIISNAGDGIQFLNQFVDANTVLSANPENPTQLFGNLGSDIVNSSSFMFSTDPLAQGNIDSRHVWWGTTDLAAIEEQIEDFFDDPSKGIVFIDPIALSSGSFLLGDVNQDGVVNGLDVGPFVDVLLNGPYQAEADMNEDQVVNGLDVDPFVAAVVGGVQQIPEPSTLLLAIVALGVVGGWRKRRGWPVGDGLPGSSWKTNHNGTIDFPHLRFPFSRNF